MASPLPPDPYVALGVPKDAAAGVVKAAYRKLVLKCHPDKVTDPAAKQAASDLFHRIQTAYEILIDEDRRGRYDAQVRLAELRREAMERRAGDGARGSHDLRSARASRDPKDGGFARGNEGMTPQFEERRPSYAPAPAPAPTTTTASAFDDAPPRATTRKEPEAERPSRRSGNEPKEKAKPAARDSSKDRQRAHREERKQRNQRDMRRDRDRKYAPHVEDESESASDEYSRRARRPREERPRDDEATLRRAREDYYEKAQRQEAEAATDGNLDPLTKKMFSQHHKAWDYIMQSRSRPAESDRRPSPTRGTSSKDGVEYVMRDDGRGTAVPVMVRRSSTRPTDRDAEPPRRRSNRDYERRSPEGTSVRPPPLPKSTSSPTDIRIPSSSQARAQSWQDDMGVQGLPPPKAPGIKRAETFNSTYGTSRRGDSGSSSSSKYYRTTDFNDGLPTPGLTPTYEASPTTKYGYGKQYADDVEYPTPDGYRTSGDSARTEMREPERSGRSAMPSYTRRMTRSPEPVSEYREPGNARERERPRPSATRYSSTSSAMPSNTRTTSYIYPGSGQGVEAVDRSRGGSVGGSRVAASPRDANPQGLFGEIPSRSKPSSDAYERVNFAQPLRPENSKASYSYKMPGSERPAGSRGGSGNPVFVR